MNSSILLKIHEDSYVNTGDIRNISFGKDDDGPFAVVIFANRNEHYVRGADVEKLRARLDRMNGEVTAEEKTDARSDIKHKAMMRLHELWRSKMITDAQRDKAVEELLSGHGLLPPFGDGISSRVLTKEDLARLTEITQEYYANHITMGDCFSQQFSILAKYS